MKKDTQRLCIYPKEVQIITGKSYRQSVRILQTIKLTYGKAVTEYVSVYEFCMYTGLDLEEVKSFL